jgi:uncharacterized membrane protein YhhN
MPISLHVLLLVLLAVASGLLTIRAEYRGARPQVYLFKPLTMVFVLLVAILPDTVPDTRYQQLIVLGLVFSLAGDVFLMLPSDRFAAGLASFFVAHLAYIAAFLPGAADELSGWTAAPFLLVVGILYRSLAGSLGRLKLPVIAYMLAIATMAWLALERWLHLDGAGALIACVGAMLFLISDAVLAIDRFRTGFAGAQAAILSSYFAAQCLIALSVGA